MRRRDFIKLIGGAATAWPLASRAQQAAKPVVGFLVPARPETYAPIIAGFRQGLNEGGFVEGLTVEIEFRWAEGQLDRLPELAADLVRRRVGVIVVNGLATPAAKAATSTIPIIFVSGGDPVHLGPATNLNRPGGNVTGVSFNTAPINPKRLELLHELVPKAAVIAALINPNNPTSETNLPSLEAAAHALGRQILIVKAATESEFDPSFTRIVQDRRS